MNVLVTGADGFVGRYLVRHLRRLGHRVWAGVRPGAPVPDGTFSTEERQGIDSVPFELLDDASVTAAMDRPIDAVVHLAAMASNAEARRDPGLAWIVNASGTARVAHAAASRTGGMPRLLLVSTGEVYGATDRMVSEGDEALPRSPYAASKVGAEVAGLEVWRRTGLPVIVARPFTHTGPGQLDAFLVPSLVRRMLQARAAGSRCIRVGNLEPVRDFSDVRDVVSAYALLIERGAAGETYNVARGEGIPLRTLFDRVAAATGVSVEPEVDPALVRRTDLPFLVGDATKLRQATGWSPAITIDQTLQDMVDAETH